MKIKYDKETDAIYVILSSDKIVESEEKLKDVIIDYNDRDEVVAIEILNVKENQHEIDLPLILKSA
ncbi:MAG: hypothetical protein A3K14_02655 [Sulfurimonas sp. RIFCSPLOWO2_12_FULL_36_74]|jgi:uncharacterized protein YuzE|uniref:DUF2283 domain-containing protein n=1 Tax=unclassified Sulfurimonas TaxID=2623549 RepID=UPI0008BFD0A1|nr:MULTISPECIES: DUF2283 domain-containing protein [unclassified Sulfurimonas]OHE02782.1 MAG: hypothetical protein A2W82_00200 [Sulfurimonas sp. RIFCSPLOWO2_12_36_12]OHE03533.1 MAG: hypothetical protein A3K14_02655 [Sulfurimonas sp. RIFCSPLOWO2_12_FULL_36_74]